MSRSQSTSSIPLARVRSATLCGGQLSPPLEDATAAAAAIGGAAGSGGSNGSSNSSAVWALRARAHSPPPALAERVAAWREVNQRPAVTPLGLRRNKSLTHREAGAGSFLHSDPIPSPIPPSLENSPYLQCEASPFYRRARLPGRSATSSVVPTLKSLNLSVDGASTAGTASACIVAGTPSPSALPTGFTSDSRGEPVVDSPRPPDSRRPSLHQRHASTPIRRAVSESSSGRSSSSNSGDSDSEGSVTGGWTPRTPPLRAAGLPGPPTVGEQQQKVRPGLPARSSYPVMTGSGKVHPPGRPTLAAMLPHSGAFQMEAIERPPVRVHLSDRP